jgi:O-antigen ligase
MPNDTRSASRHPQRVLLAAVLLICLLVPLAFSPWREEVFAPIKIQVLQGLIGIGLFAIGAGLLFGWSSDVRLLPAVDLAAVVFGVTNLLACAHSVHPGDSWLGLFPEYQGLATVLTYLAAYGLARLAFTPPPGAPRFGPLDALFGVLTVTTGLIGGYAVAQRLGLDPIWGSAERPFATVGQANSMAAMLVVGLPAVAATYAARRGWVRVAVVAAGALGTLGLLMSLSRGGWLAAFVAGGIGLALHRPRVHLGHLALAAAFVVLLAVGLAALPAGRDLVSQAATRVVATSSVGTGSTGKHLALARIGVAVTVDHPWLGIGQDTFPELAQGYADRHLPRHYADLLRSRRSESPHNALLSISSGAGLPALLAYLAFLGAAARRMLVARRSAGARAVPVLMILAGYLVSSLFMTPEVSSTVSLWIVVGAACSVIRPDTGPRPRSPAPSAQPSVRTALPSADSVGTGTAGEGRAMMARGASRRETGNLH